MLHNPLPQNLFFFKLGNALNISLALSLLRILTSSVGAIISNNSELEEEIVPIITKGNIEQYYTIGNTILDKYYYTENLSSIKNPIIKDSYSNFNLTIILLWGVFFIDLGRKTSWLHARGCKPITLIFGLVYIF